MSPNFLKSPFCLIVLPIAVLPVCHAATAVWFDGFDTAGATSNINQDIGTRQGGPLGAISYLTNTSDPSTDFRHQMFGAAPLQLAGDAGGGSFAAGPTGGYSTLVSPNYNFVGSYAGGALGTQIDLNMDAIYNAAGSYYSWAAITVASSSALQYAGAATNGFSVRFLEQDLGGGPSQTIDFYDGGSLVASYANPAGAGPMFVQLFISDPGDSNPWDGVGSTSIGLAVNGTPVGSYLKAGGGYASNYITLEGSMDLAGADTALHTFDNLTIYAADPIPEPSGVMLGVLGVLGLLCRRRTA